MKNLLLMCVLFLCTFGVFAESNIENNNVGFKIYDAIPYGKPFGVKPGILYESIFYSHSEFDIPQIQYDKINSVVSNDSIWILDNEFGNRFDPSTVLPDTITIMGYLKNTLRIKELGMYAVFPQNIYGWKYAQLFGLNNYKKLNDKYVRCLNYITNMHPVMYNYGDDVLFETWKKSARWLIDESNRLSKGTKKIIPFISTDICVDKSCNIIKQLDPIELRKRINYLRQFKNRNVAGVVIWAKSGALLENNNRPTIEQYGLK